MDPKLRPSFSDIVKDLDGILVRLKLEEMEHGDAKLSGDNDKKTICKGQQRTVMLRVSGSGRKTTPNNLFYVFLDCQNLHFIKFPLQPSKCGDWHKYPLSHESTVHGAQAVIQTIIIASSSGTVMSIFLGFLIKVTYQSREHTRPVFS